MHAHDTQPCRKSMTKAYVPRKKPAHRHIKVRSLKYTLHCWGDSKAKPVFLLHGWVDTGMSFQFLADAMGDGWYLIAPDWRGFGDTDWSPEGYWFPDYLGDLEKILDQLCPDEPVRLAGHSMGGNIAWLYAGIRPERVSHAVSLDVFGLPAVSPDAAPDRYGKWLDQLNQAQRFTEYDAIDGVVKLITGLAPRMAPEQALFLARHWSQKTAGGKYVLKADPLHKRIYPIPYRREEARNCWKRSRAKTLLVLAGDSDLYKKYYAEGYQLDVMECFDELSEVVIKNAGHMLHLDQPRELARVLETFLAL